MVRSNFYNGSEDSDYSSQQNNRGLDKLLLLLLRRWYIIALGVGLALGAAWYHLQGEVSIYRTRAKVYVRQESEKQAMELQFYQSFNSGDNSLTNRIQFLKNSSLISQVVDSFNLHHQYFLEDRFKNVELFGDNNPIRLTGISPESKAYGKSFRIRMRDTSSFVLYHSEEEADTTVHHYDTPFQYQGVYFTLEAVGEPMKKNLIVSVRRPFDVARKFTGRIKLQQAYVNGSPSDMLEVRLDDAVTDRAILLINNIIDLYNKQNIESKRRADEKRLKFIDDRLNFITQELYAVERRVEGFRKERQLPSGVSTSADRMLSLMQAQTEQLNQIELQKRLLSNIEEIFTSEADSMETLPVASSILQGPLVTMVVEYNKLILQKESLTATATPDNPMVHRLNEQLDQLKGSIMLNVASTRQELNQREKKLEEQIQPIQERINALPTYERELVQIMRQRQIKENLFLFLLQRREETAITLSGKMADIQIIEPPYGFDLVHPNSRFIYMVALFLGFVTTTGGLFLRFITDKRIRSIKDITSRTGLPFLGAIPQVSGKRNVVVDDANRSAEAEMFRMLRTNLQFMTPGKKRQVYLITSSYSGEGKTFISINLSVSLALSGNRTLVVGLDMRRPKVNKYLMTVGEEQLNAGISNYLVGDCGFEDIAQQSQLNENLYFISSGALPPNPSELLHTERLAKFFKEASEEFDYIILDSPPIGLVTDALLLHDYVTASLYVMRSGVTTTEELEILKDATMKKALAAPGIVLNGIRPGQGYGSKRYYRYGRRYGYYEHDKGKRLQRLSRSIGIKV